MAYFSLSCFEHRLSVQVMLVGFQNISGYIWRCHLYGRQFPKDALDYTVKEINIKEIFALYARFTLFPCADLSLCFRHIRPLWYRLCARVTLQCTTVLYWRLSFIACCGRKIYTVFDLMSRRLSTLFIGSIKCRLVLSSLYSFVCFKRIRVT